MHLMTVLTRAHASWLSSHLQRALLNSFAYIDGLTVLSLMLYVSYRRVLTLHTVASLFHPTSTSDKINYSFIFLDVMTIDACWLFELWCINSCSLLVKTFEDMVLVRLNIASRWDRAASVRRKEQRNLEKTMRITFRSTHLFYQFDLSSSPE